MNRPRNAINCNGQVSPNLKDLFNGDGVIEGIRIQLVGLWVYSRLSAQRSLWVVLGIECSAGIKEVQCHNSNTIFLLPPKGVFADHFNLV